MIVVLAIYLFKALVAFLIGFFFWRRLKNDYAPSLLLWIYLISLLGTVVFLPLPDLIYRLSQFRFTLSPDILSLAGVLVGFLFCIRIYRREKINFWELADFVWLSAGAMRLASIIIALLLAKPLSLPPSLSGAIHFGWWLIVWGLSFWVSLNFRQLAWYKSGRVGLTAILGSAVFFMGNGILAFLLPRDLYWTDFSQINSILSLLISAGLICLSIRHAGLKIRLDTLLKLSQINILANFPGRKSSRNN